MKIAINARFLTQKVTGVQRYAREVTKRLINMLGKDCIVLLAPSQAPEVFHGIEVTKPRIRVNGYLWEQLVLPNMFLRAKADLLWSPGNVGPLILKDQVVTIHDAAVFAMPDGFDGRFRSWYRFALPRLAKTVRKILTVSEFSKVELAHFLGVKQSKIEVAYPGVSDFFCPQCASDVRDLKSRLNLPNKYVLALMSLGPNKNIQGLLDAWSLIEPRLSEDVYLVIAGGKAKTLASTFVDNGTGYCAKVKFTGYINDEDLPLLYSGAELFVFPSLYEGFGLPPLEAMACGVPVVCSNAASLPEVVGDAALLVEAADIESLAGRIYELLNNGELRENLRDKGLKRASMFDWEITSQKIAEILSDI